MSSSLLYLAIVAIWAFVLVPRWLRRHNARPGTRADAEVGFAYAAESELAPRYDDDIDGSEADEYSSAAYETGYPAAGGVSGSVRPAWQSYAPSSRSRVLKVRRRLLTMLVLLTAVAFACTALKLTSWWVGIAPAAMLGIYLLLLREAALADAEQARWQATMESRLRAGRQRAYSAAMAMERAQQSAEIIDISDRVGDQLYDQYEDATVRAVGD